jgi:hypothetical protein
MNLAPTNHTGLSTGCATHSLFVSLIAFYIAPSFAWNQEKVPLTPEERIIAWLGVIFLIAGVVFQGLQYFGVKASSFLPYSATAVGFVIGGVALITLGLILRSVTNRLLAKYTEELKGESSASKSSNQPPRTDDELITLSIIPNLSHLTIHFAEKDASPTNPNRKYFIVNTSTKHAYWVTEYLLELAKRGRILWVTHDGEADTVNYLAASGITVHNAYPKNWELAGR